MSHVPPSLPLRRRTPSRAVGELVEVIVNTEGIDEAMSEVASRHDQLSRVLHLGALRMFLPIAHLAVVRAELTPTTIPMIPRQACGDSQQHKADRDREKVPAPNDEDDPERPETMMAAIMLPPVGRPSALDSGSVR
jgi:hypothetical protein